MVPGKVSKGINSIRLPQPKPPPKWNSPKTKNSTEFFLTCLFNFNKMENTLLCTHSICKYGRLGVERYKCASESGRRKHHQKTECHPCCNSTSKCDTGKKITKWKTPKRKRETGGTFNLEEPAPKMRPHQCKHDSCEQFFIYPSHAKRHEKIKHPNCSPSCNVCQLSVAEAPVIQPAPNPFSLMTGTAIIRDGGESIPFSCGAIATIDMLTSVLPDFTVAQRRVVEYVKKIITSDHLWQKLATCTTYEEKIETLKEHPLSMLNALLSMKDRLSISDKNWKVVEEVFCLPTGFKIFHIRALRKKEDSSRGLFTSASGCHNSFFSTIDYAIRLEKPSTDEILLKLSFDAGRITNKIQEELVCLEIISGKSIAQCKSAHNVHLLSLFMGCNRGDDPENLPLLREELKFVVQGLELLKQNGNIFTVDGKQYKIKVCMCTDMKALTIALGLNSVWHHKSTYRCCWCEVHTDQLADWSVPSYQLRSIDKMLAFKVSTAEATRKKAAKNHTGQYDKPIFQIPLDCIIPCVLHLSMSMVKLLLRTLAEHIQYSSFSSV